MISEQHLTSSTQETESWGQLEGAAKAHYLAKLAQSQQQPICIIVSDIKSATELEQELGFFLKSTHIPILPFPDWETLPYDHFSPHQDLISQRLATLAQLAFLKQGIVIVPISTLMHQIAPVDFIAGCSFILRVGQQFNPEKIRKSLQQLGYYSVPQVNEHGEFSIRGSIFDFFPMGSSTPYRIDLFDDEIDSIQTFDPQNQRSIDKVERVDLLPAKEFPITDEAISQFRQTWREKFPGNPSTCPVYQDMSQGICSNGIEYYLPFFFQQTASLLDYLNSDTIIVRDENIHSQAEIFWKEINERFEQCNIDITRPLLEPSELFFTVEELFSNTKNFKQIFISSKKQSHKNFSTKRPPSLMVNHRIENPIETLQDFISNNNKRILICAESAGRKESLITLLNKQRLGHSVVSHWEDFLKNDGAISIVVAPLIQGVILELENVVIITESELFGQQVFQQRRRKKQTIESENIVKNLAELSIGTPVVHMEHGIGRYVGLTTLQSGDQQNEYLLLEYAGDDRLYVPISSLELISRYSGVEVENAPMHQLGSKKWQKAKEKAAKQIRDVAAELLDIYAKRACKKGNVFHLPEAQYAQFVAGFPFEETPDQNQAIENVIKDLQSDQPMDRLVCGDVGFGKTEVAMRATFIAVQNNKQVAILVPTTLLAQQHFETFSDRFSEWPIAIEMISRFKTAKEQEIILKRLTEGKVDVIIGTHKLIQGNINFKQLGLLIVDEEHRFGVRQKEKLKQLRAEVDLLNLTATPIPRTLNMSMSGIRDMSIIATPPAKRLSIKTFVVEKNKQIIRDAIMREIMRGGQVYFLHNKVDSIQMMVHELEGIVPEARIRMGHGQMPERDLEQVMGDFYHQRFNVLVCSTIIETGIDVPTANTIIIHRADHFGLSQLHQLRGRVGRSHHQAYAYLMVPDKKLLGKNAKKRLDAISALEDLGAGFTLASHDLEIRGAGELLGEEQSGNIHDIGLTLYTELLDRTINSLKEGKTPDINITAPKTTDIDLKITALIPEDYLPDTHTRLILYKRIASIASNKALDEFQVELIDRFGLLPEPVKNLLQLTKIKLRCLLIGINKIDANQQGGRVEFIDKPSVDPMAIIKLIQSQSDRYQLVGANVLRFKWNAVGSQQRLTSINALLDKLTALED